MIALWLCIVIKCLLSRFHRVATASPISLRKFCGIENSPSSTMKQPTCTLFVVPAPKVMPIDMCVTPVIPGAHLNTVLAVTVELSEGDIPNNGMLFGTCIFVNAGNSSPGISNRKFETGSKGPMVSE